MNEPSYLDLLERRIELADALSDSLLAASSAVIAVDLNALESQIAEQRKICANIEDLDEQIERLQYQCAARLRMQGDGAEVPSAGTSSLKDAMLRLCQAQARVKELNSAHQALLTRSRRTITALLNSLHLFENGHGLYAAPPPLVSAFAKKV
jgi:hypothetical protein